MAVATGAVVVLLCGLGLVLPERDGGALEPRSPVPSSPVALDASVEEVRAPVADRGPLAVVPMPSAVSGEALATALGEERVVLASSTVIERIEMDRPWVCAGGQVSLAARVGGTSEAGALYRWVWPGQETGAELHPGARLQWRAPASSGPAFVRFQVCKDLGGRRVGVLAEQVLRIEVRDCTDAASREELEVAVIQRTNEAFLFRAVSPEAVSLTGYSWDFGDGRSAVSAGPEVEHVYDTRTPDVRTFTVRLTAVQHTGSPLSATAFVSVRGQPLSDELLPATLTLSRTSASAELWRSEVAVDVPEEGDVTWERVERMTLHWDDQVEVTTRDWHDLITVEEERGRGAFRGFVEVRPSELASTVKQVVDVLHGRYAAGAGVSLSWASFKRESSRSAEARPPLK
ncbi:PKD domain-containing protein [Myxococcus landrumensis]|uniref:PKD domain-containing protein n=1 Tax=Myxococcus landrumensis TaxID=2813577 RepID=A0ABX7N9H9_9BACT|nr:PKD domain-containing protein [Myxococcus landrumus]QSQ14194.1 PKD domain-containing protein [Myxococcus landrumus]